MGQGNGRPSAGLIALGAGATVLCCAVPLLLLGFGTAGLVALITGNAWWSGLGVTALALAVVLNRARRTAHRASDTFRREIANG